MKIKYARPFFAIVSCILMVSCNNTNPKRTNNTDTLSQDSEIPKTPQKNKALVLNLYQALNDTNWTVAKSCIHQDFKHHFVKDSAFGETTWAGFEKGYRMSHTAFPDWKLTVINVVAEGDYVAVLLNGQGTHQREFAGLPATYRKAGAPIMLLHKIKDGKIIEDWEIMNTSSFVEQLKKQ